MSLLFDKFFRSGVPEDTGFVTANRKRFIRFGGAALIVFLILYKAIPPLYQYVLPIFSEEEVQVPFKVDAVVINGTQLEDKIMANGTIRAIQEVSLNAEVSGKITELNIDEGNEVEQGHLLVKINDNDLQAELRGVQYKLEVMIEAENRQRQLFEQGGATRENYENVRMQLNELISRQDYLEAQIERTEIRAPFKGVLGLSNVNTGSYITPTSRIATLQDISSVRIDFSVPERYSTYISPGNEILFTVAGSDSVFTGYVHAIEPQIDPRARTLQIRAVSNNEDGLLNPGAFASIDLLLSRHEDAVVIPAIALRPNAGRQHVMVYENGIVRERSVETGIRQERTIQIIAGLAENDTLLINGFHRLHDGLPVGIRELKKIN